eukprot:383129_1
MSWNPAVREAMRNYQVEKRKSNGTRNAQVEEAGKFIGSNVGETLAADVIERGMERAVGGALPGAGGMALAHITGPIHAARGNDASAVGAATGAYGGMAGAWIGSFFGPVGTVIGGLIGGFGGAFAGSGMVANRK